MTTKNSRENSATSSDNTSIASTVKFTLLGKNEIEEKYLHCIYSEVHTSREEWNSVSTQ